MERFKNNRFLIVEGEIQKKVMEHSLLQPKVIVILCITLLEHKIKKEQSKNSFIESGLFVVFFHIDNYRGRI